MKNTITLSVGNTYASKNSKAASTVEWTLVELSKNEVSVQVKGKALVKVIPLDMFNRNWVLVTDNSVKADNSVQTYENGSTIVFNNGATFELKLNDGKAELYGSRKNVAVHVRKIFNEINGEPSVPFFKIQNKTYFVKEVK